MSADEEYREEYTPVIVTEYYWDIPDYTDHFFH